jgi:hypothetical protein
MTSLSALALLGAVAVAFTVSGRLLVAALRLRWLLPFEPTRAAASTVLGTAFCVVAFDRLSGAGTPAPRILVLLALAHAGLLAVAVGRGELRALRPVGRASGWIGLLAAASLAGALALLPILRASGYHVANDTYTYCAFSEWLQDHAFGVRASYDPGSPVSAIPVQWQEWGFPLGASYALALVRAATGSLAVAVYPVVSAWSMLLAACAIWVSTRWVLRLSPAWAVAAAGGFALLPHPGYWAHHNGFLSQTSAVPALLLAIATAARIERSRRRIASAVAVLSVLAAYLLAVYLPFLPLAGGAALAGALAGLRRAPGGPARVRCIALHASTAALFVALAGLNLGPLLRGLPILSAVTVGYAIPLSASGFLSFAVGTRLFAPGFRIAAPSWPLPLVATGAAILLAGLGLAQASRRRHVSLLAVAAILASLVGYQAIVARDPWSGHTGHTWNVFKAVQWAFPVTLLLQVAGAARLARWPGGRAILLGLPVLLSFHSAVHWRWSEALGRRMRNVIMAEQPLRALPGIQRRLASLPPGTLLLLGRPARASAWLAPYAALLAYPRPIVGDWVGSAANPLPGEAMLPAYEASLARIGAPDVVVLRAGVPDPIDARGAQILGGGMARLLDMGRPRLVQVAPVREAAPERGQAPLRVGSHSSMGHLNLVFFSARELGADLQIAGRSNASRLSLVVQVVPGIPSGRALRAALEEALPATLSGASPQVARARLRFGPGLSTVVLSSRSGSTVEIDDVATVAQR